ncbi:hypothetical protein GOBAR_AA24791 [Gossypium barbadense]|uniref:Uncharacterized protein n=1 Tax=Gossypium barbadense TaxID=3634 RepID=A0A2P5WXQ8_GOSBA|nr:hypothetical protein GOBAR_AA24791 [Gossypium barbadense]
MHSRLGVRSGFGWVVDRLSFLFLSICTLKVGSFKIGLRIESGFNPSNKGTLLHPFSNQILKDMATLQKVDGAVVTI